jgi:hypothetical protein
MFFGGQRARVTGWARPALVVACRHAGGQVAGPDMRAREVIRPVAERGLPEAADLAEAYREACGDARRPALP